MAARYHSLVLLLSITLAYLWLQVPFLKPYSFQVFAVLVATFFIIKRFKKAKIWHILPDWASLEITLITFAFLLLIGATGNTSSLFYPLAYVHLFFLVMTSHTQTAIVATIAIMLFHYALEPGLEVNTIQTLINLPIMLAIFLFARKEYDEAHLAKLASARRDALEESSETATTAGNTADAEPGTTHPTASTQPDTAHPTASTQPDTAHSTPDTTESEVLNQSTTTESNSAKT